jgi:hypothetical protein
MILTDQCAGGAFLCLHPDVHVFLSSSLLLEHSSFHCSNTNARGCTEDCPWLTPTNGDFVLECKDGSTCDVLREGWTCCSERGGRAKCPLAFPLMCAQSNCEDGDYSCANDCDGLGGIRLCGELISGDNACLILNSKAKFAYACLLLTNLVGPRIEIQASSTFCLLNFLA